MMNRRKFLHSFFILPTLPLMNQLSDLETWTASLPKTLPMPVLFLGHGSPMNAIEENIFVQGFRNVAKNIPKPTAIICVSAHWYTSGTMVTSMQLPPTIHDFSGFPPALSQVQYPASGSPALAAEIKKMLEPENIILDESWGLDHGAWSVLIHMYPNANIPIIQLSIDYRKPASWHFALAERMKKLREKGVLIVGSGNIIHNLRLVDFAGINRIDYGYDWAQDANHQFHELINKRDWKRLMEYHQLNKSIQLAIPSPDHYLPLMYTLGLSNHNEPIKLFNDHLLAGSLSMTSIQIG